MVPIVTQPKLSVTIVAPPIHLKQSGMVHFTLQDGHRQRYRQSRETEVQTEIQTEIQTEETSRRTDRADRGTDRQRYREIQTQQKDRGTDFSTHLPVVHHSHGGGLPTGDADHHLVLQAVGDLAWGGLVGRGPRAHLAAVIIAPGIHLQKQTQESP